MEGRSDREKVAPVRGWRKLFSKGRQPQEKIPSISTDQGYFPRPEKWSMGILNDKETVEVPGSILLLSKESGRNEPLGLRNAPARTSASSFPSPFPTVSAPGSQHASRPPLGPRTRSSNPEVEEEEGKKKTANGDIILEPQPDDSLNDPLNWPSWRRDIALLCLGLYCMIGGGMTPVLAAGFNNVSQTYNVPVTRVALTTGFFMMGLGLGSVVASPTAILFGKRPVYLVGAALFCVSAIWCALSPNYSSLVVARIFMGVAVSPVECLPSASIAEIFFLHERAYRLGIYTLLLLGGKNLFPLISAAIIQGKDWEWVFWIVAMIVAFCWVLIFLFVPETFWDRTPRPKMYSKSRGALASLGHLFTPSLHKKPSHPVDDHGLDVDGPSDMRRLALDHAVAGKGVGPFSGTIAQRRRQKMGHHVGFATDVVEPEQETSMGREPRIDGVASPEFQDAHSRIPSPADDDRNDPPPTATHLEVPGTVEISVPVRPLANHSESWRVEPRGEGPKTPALHNFNSPSYLGEGSDYITNPHDPEALGSALTIPGSMRTEPATGAHFASPATNSQATAPLPYTHHLRTQPPKTFTQTLCVFHGRLRNENWFKVACRPFILFAYPAILWSTLLYSLSVGWLIVLSESISAIYRTPTTGPYAYNFSALQAGLVYLSPFVGGILGTAVAGKLSDIIVRWMSRRNGGIYEPEFRLVMAIPVAVSTCIGLTGFGWSAGARDGWAVPTVFFGVISFGCSLGSTTAITFAVDSYRQYAGEALVTLNFSKNIFHGLVFSLFFPEWLQADGSKTVFLVIGGIQLLCLATTVPMYIYGKRARMWTVRKNMMERF